MGEHRTEALYTFYLSIRVYREFQEQRKKTGRSLRTKLAFLFLYCSRNIHVRERVPVVPLLPQYRFPPRRLTLPCVSCIA